MLTLKNLDHLVVNVRDVEASAEWYGRVLGMKREDHRPPEGIARTSMKFGTMKLNLRPVDLVGPAWFTAAHPMAGSEDLCFVTDALPVAVARHLEECGVVIYAGPVARRGALGSMTSIYCHDPDGNLIEIARYDDTEPAA